MKLKSLEKMNLKALRAEYLAAARAANKRLNEIQRQGLESKYYGSDTQRVYDLFEAGQLRGFKAYSRIFSSSPLQPYRGGDPEGGVWAFSESTSGISKKQLKKEIEQIRNFMQGSKLKDLKKKKAEVVSRVKMIVESPAVDQIDDLDDLGDVGAHVPLPPSWVEDEEPEPEQMDYTKKFTEMTEEERIVAASADLQDFDDPNVFYNLLESYLDRVAEYTTSPDKDSEYVYRIGHDMYKRALKKGKSLSLADISKAIGDQTIKIKEREERRRRDLPPGVLPFDNEWGGF